MVSLRALAINALVGLVLLIIVNVMGLGVQISVITLLICAVLGIPGAALVTLLALVDVAFMATLFSALPV